MPTLAPSLLLPKQETVEAIDLCQENLEPAPFELPPFLNRKRPAIPLPKPMRKPQPAGSAATHSINLTEVPLLWRKVSNSRLPRPAVCIIFILTHGMAWLIS